MAEVYANILEALTSGLYNEVNLSIREYLQNAYDAIKKAKKDGMREPEEGYNIAVSVTKDNHCITISDNGIGMDRDLLGEYTSIGGGTKNDPDFTGHKGIGKLSGLRFFDKFIVRTKTSDSKKGYELIWESGAMMKNLQKNMELMKKTPYKNFINNYVQINEIADVGIDDHFTQVQLINVMDEFKDQVTEEDIGNFIKMNCPVPYLNEGFEYSNQISEFVGSDCMFIPTLINDKLIFQFYNDNYCLMNPVQKIIKYDDKIRAKCWFSWKKNTAEIETHDEICGIKFRCKGICVGDNNLFANNCMPPGRDSFSKWFTGEVIIIDNDIKPNTARNSFYEGNKLQQLYREIKNKVGKELSSLADMRSGLSAAARELKELKEAQKKNDRKTISAKLKKVDERIKFLSKFKNRELHGLDFEILDELLIAMNSEEEKIKKEIPVIEKEVDKLLQEGSTEDIVEKVIELTEEKLHTSTKEAKKALQKSIDKIKHNLGVINKTDINEAQQQIVKIIIKYLEHLKITYDENDIVKFVGREIKNGK